ncbi:MAG: PorV/PorQ family protein [Endomicrobiales bacterium]|nr:PorV/PorQ family protein [Endomicrobiales bacterium]
MKTKKILLLFSLLSLSAMPVFSGDKDGTSTAAFLRQEQGVRALGMGGAFVAIDNDIESVWWNPAGTAFIDALQINFSYSDYISDISGYYSAIAWPKGRSTILANINYMTLGEIETRDAFGNLGDKIKLTNMVASFGFAMPTAPNMSLGLVAKNIQQNLGDYKSSGFAADIGLLLKVSPILSFGFCAQNVGPKLETSGVENELPMNLRAGLAYKVSPKVLISGEGEQPKDADARIHAGTEIQMSDSFCFRAGYNTSKAVGFTAGIGVLTPITLKKSEEGDPMSPWWKEATDKDWKHNVVRIDYAYITSGELDATHRLSLTLKF